VIRETYRRSSGFNVRLTPFKFSNRLTLTQIGRDAEGAIQTLAVDLRKLRNALEDLEEATPEGSHERTFASQVPQCKAILLGLDLTLQSIHCQEQQDSQPQSVLAAKASVQIMTNCLVYALDNTSAPRQEAVLAQDTPAEGGALRCSTQSDALNDDAQSTDTSCAATYTTSSNRSSAKITGLESNQLLKKSVISLQAILNGERALKPIPYPDAISAPAGTGSIDWRPPFSPRDSVSSNDTGSRVFDRAVHQPPAHHSTNDHQRLRQRGSRYYCRHPRGLIKLGHRSFDVELQLGSLERPSWLDIIYNFTNRPTSSRTK
jgi:hypothetical protein